MNSEMKSAKWLWGGIGLQLAVGYTVSYVVYTVGTLIFAPQSFNVVAGICGLLIVLVAVAVIIALIKRTEEKLKKLG
jgi:ferrous iron transport protein B